MTIRLLCSAITAAGIVLSASAHAAAQSYPSRPVKMVVPFAAGGADVLGRLVAEQLRVNLGQPVVIENRPGAGGTVGAKAVAGAEPDGHTLLFASPGSITVGPAAYRNLDYDPVKSFVPVAMIATSPFILVVHPAVPASSVADLIAYAKANPGKLNFASPGYGTQPHFISELFKQKTGTNLVHVPYRGAAPAFTDLVAGQVQIFFDNLRNAAPFIQAGKVRALAVTSASRSADMPDLPTLAEAGVDAILATYWNAILAPAGTPAPIADKLNTAVNQILKSPEMQTSLAKLGMEAKIGSRDDLAALIVEEMQKWAAVAKSAGIQVD
jgi:tripartite-type tricarboxylate transporter receptor subunit TctC